jgi:CRP-like cAMP-binding protein
MSGTKVCDWKSSADERRGRPGVADFSRAFAMQQTVGSGRSANLLVTDILFTRLSKLNELAEHERGVLRLIEGRPKRSYRADDRILSERSEIHGPHFIISGWACSMRELNDGRRQIFNVLLPGDAIGLSVRSRPRSFANVIALTTVRTVDAPEIAVAWRERTRVPGIAAALDLIAEEDEFFTLGHVMRLGRQNAYERTAHWFMELDYRMAARGLGNGTSFPMPMTQEMMASALGLSVVHVNRTLQQMRREGRIELRQGRLSLLDKPALAAAGEFVPPMQPAPMADAHP